MSVVVVVGAGFIIFAFCLCFSCIPTSGISGLACARSLRKNGFSVVVLEGRDRIGGRIHTSNDCDLGASWIHHSDDNPLMKEFPDIETIPSPFDGNHVACFDANGRRITPEEFDASEAVFHKALNEKVAKRREELSKDIDLFSSLVKASGAMTPVLWGQMLSMHSLLGADLKNVSTWYWDDEDEKSGVDRYFPKGYSQIVSQLAEGTEIILNCSVVKVEYKRKKGVSILTADGRLFTADFAVVTVPLGVLKRNFINFVPPLPKKVTSAIDRIGFGTLNKIILRFDDVFWDKESVWLSFDPLNENDFVVVDLLNLYRCNGQPMLVGFTGGSFAESLSQRSDESIGGMVMSVIRRAYPLAPKYQSILVTRWNQDSFAFGSYSHFKLGGKGRKDIKKLAKPIRKRLFFAGEHTSLVSPAYVDGAYESGLRAAKQISKRK